MAHTPKPRRTINVFVLAMLSLAVVVSLRNLPLTAEYGLSAIFFYAAACICFMIPYALVSAELASGWPKAGGVFIWVKEALGQRWGFLAIWLQWFHNMTWYPAMLAFIAAALAQLIDPLLVQNKIYVISVILIGFWGVTFLNFFGIKTSALVSTISVILGVIIPGIILVALAIYWLKSGGVIAIPLNVSNLFPDLSSRDNLVFLSGIFLALSGLEANANLARDVKHPQKNYPRAIFIAAALTVTILILGSLSIAIVIPREGISLVSGLLDTFHYFFQVLGLSWIVPILALLIVIGAFGELNAWAIAGVKGLFVTTEYGCLPPSLHKLNKHHTPIHLLLLQAVVVTIAAFTFLYLPNINLSYWLLSAWSAQMYLLTYILLFIAALVLRYRRPDVHRVYKIPGRMVGIWVVSLLGIGSALFVLAMSFLPPTAQFDIPSIMRYEGLILIGFLINCGIPLVLYALRKPHWKIEILDEIREEIHEATH